MALEERLQELRKEYQKTADPVKREIIKRQARALKIGLQENSKGL